MSDDLAIKDHADCGEWINCPHCQGQILVGFRARARITGVSIGGDTATPPNNRIELWRSTLSQDQLSILDHATRSGLLGSFVAALQRAPHHGLPSNTEKYFLDWCRMARPKLVPSWAMKEFSGLYPGTDIKFFGSQFVGAVISNGEIMLFMPVDLIGNGKTVMLGGTEKHFTPPDISGVRQWLHTKMGYVPQEARVMLAETRKRSIGEFANPVL